MSSISRTTIASVTLAFSLASCTASGAPTKAGGAPPTLTLTAIAPAPAGFPGGDQLVEYAKQVDAISDGAIAIDISSALDVSRKDNDITAIGMVRNGQVDLGVIPARAFDLVGISGLRALQTPFLIDNSDLAVDVLADPIADEMLASLDNGGLTGLGLAFDALRNPVGFGAPLVSVADYSGATIGAPQSKTTSQLLEALGATVTDARGDELETRIIAGEVAGVEDSMGVPTAPEPGPVTGNEVLFVKANAIVVSSKVFAGLTASQQSVLRRAALKTRDWAAEQRPDEVAAAAAYCADQHGDVVVATDGELAELHQAAEPVVAQLRQDPLTAKAIDKIEQLASTRPAPVITPCEAAGPDVSTDSPTGSTAGDQSALDGVWRLDVELDPNADRPGAVKDASLNNGTWTWTLNAGTFDYLEPRGRRAHGSFVIDGSDVILTETDGTVWEFAFERDGDEMTWTPAGEGADDPVLAEFVTNGLVRVGDAG